MGRINFVCALLSLAGCFYGHGRTPPETRPVSTEPKVALYQRKEKYNEEEYAPYKKAGTGSISGQAFAKTNRGDVKYGAGNTVFLTPETKYSAEWYAYGVVLRNKFAEPGVPEAGAFTRETLGDGFGHFRFEELPAGDYYVFCEIKWRVSMHEETGGYVYARVSLKDGEKKTVVVTR